MEIFLGVLAVIVSFLAVLIIRTLAFRPKREVETDFGEVSFSLDKAVECLCELVRCKTVSYRDSSLEDNAEFEKLISKLPKLYPNIFEKCEYKQLEDRALLFKWEGKNHNEPTVLMAHYDVVPVNEEAWEKPPFDAIIENGVIWGRGTLDTKVTFSAALFSVDTLIAEGFVPENDIYLAFSGGEEVNGKGAVNIVDYFEKENIIPALVLDEGGAVVENVFPGVKGSCGLIGIAEKGMMDVEYKAKSQGGHASSPKPHTPVGILSKACTRVEAKPFKSHLTLPVAAMFDTLGRHSTFLYRMIFANLFCFKPVLDLICKKSGGELNALMRTTVAFTQMKGSDASNVIPPEASMVSNIRLNPEDNMNSALDYLKKVVGDENVSVNILHGMNPSRVSRIDCDAYEKVAKAIRQTWKGCIVSPYLMVACSDSRHYGRISDKVYRFSAMALSNEERALIHGNNERIPIETVKSAVEFYIRLIKMC
ncbi:MAG: M20/M25/M40 family metallo-hydrolase [Oscillospiraceae bacterium]|nr:M20/M25/M40 family metallo-hydrolase [Oscillospiraceae bacterium]